MTAGGVRSACFFLKQTTMKRIITTVTVLLFAFIATAQIAPFKIHNNKVYVIWQGDTLKLGVNPDSSVISGNNRLNMSHDSIYFPHLATGATDTNIMFIRGSDGKMMYLRPADIGIGNSYWAKNGVLHPTDTANAVAIGTNAVASGTMLRVNNGSVLFDGTTGTTPVSGAGTRFMWIPEMAAFRAGYVEETEWDDANIGFYSSAFGYGTTASGDGSHAEGESTKANGYNSHAEGAVTIASGDMSHAEGHSTTTSGYYSHAEGAATIASGNVSHAEGESTKANGHYSHAEGYFTTASGDHSHAGGYRTTANSYILFASGRYNDTTLSTDKFNWVNTDPLFQIGNGTDTGANSNDALRILKNGTAYIGDASSTTDPILTVSTTDSTTTALGKLNVENASDSITITASEGIRLYGNATTWEDLQFPLTAAKLTGVSDPNFTKIADNGAGSTGIYAYSFSATTNQQVFIGAEMLHEWKEGSDYYLHLHWYPATTDTGRVVFSVEWATNNIGSVVGNSTVSTYTYNIDTNKQKQQIMTEILTIPGAGLTISHGMSFTIKRLGSDGNDTYPGAVWITRAAIHYEKDSFGSNTKTDK